MAALTEILTSHQIERLLSEKAFTKESEDIVCSILEHYQASTRTMIGKDRLHSMQTVIIDSSDDDELEQHDGGAAGSDSEEGGESEHDTDEREDVEEVDEIEELEDLDDVDEGDYDA